MSQIEIVSFKFNKNNKKIHTKWIKKSLLTKTIRLTKKKKKKKQKTKRKKL